MITEPHKEYSTGKKALGSPISCETCLLNMQPMCILRLQFHVISFDFLKECNFIHKLDFFLNEGNLKGETQDIPLHHTQYCLFCINYTAHSDA